MTFRDTHERATAFGVSGAVAGVAIAVGPVLGGVLIVHFWVGSIFLINLPIVAVAVVLIAAVVPESRSPEQHRVDAVDFVLGTGGVTALVLRSSKARPGAGSRPPRWACSAPPRR